MDFYRIEYQLNAPGSFLRAFVEKSVSIAAGTAYSGWLANPSAANRGFQFDGFLSFPPSADVRKFVVDHDAVLHFVSSYSPEFGGQKSSSAKKVPTKSRRVKSAA